MNPLELEVDAEIPTFVRSTGFAEWNRFAAVNDEFVPIHMDHEAGVEAGMGGAIGMGTLQWAYLHSLLRSWLGDAGSIKRIECQFRSPNKKGDTVTARGVVTGSTGRGTETEVALKVWTENQDGDVLARGTAVVVILGS